MSEALSYGIPSVMSKLSADAFGLSPEKKVTCIGEDAESFKSCVLSVHGSEKKWNELRNGGLSFIQKTHNRVEVERKWSRVIDSGKREYMDMKAADQQAIITSHNLFSTNLEGQLIAPQS